MHSKIQVFIKFIWSSGTPHILMVLEVQNGFFKRNNFMTQTLRLWIDHLSLWSGHCVFNKTKLVKMKSVSNATRVRTAALVYTSSYLCVTYKHLWRMGGYVLSNYTSLCGKKMRYREVTVLYFQFYHSTWIRKSSVI